MAYEGKTDWQYNDTVREQDLNRIEGGIVEAQEKLDVHASRADNPHRVTAYQIGAATLHDVDLRMDLHEGKMLDAHSASAINVEIENSYVSNLEHALNELYAHVRDRQNPHLLQAWNVGAIPDYEKGKAYGVATLDSNSRVHVDQLKNVPLPAEIPWPLWVYSGSVSLSSGETAAGKFVTKGTTTLTATSIPACHLHTLANWPAGTKFAFEAVLRTANTTHTAYAALYDMTSKAIVPGSQVSVTSTGESRVIRSGPVTLTTGRQYGVTVWVSNSTGQVMLSEAYLVILPSF